MVSLETVLRTEAIPALAFWKILRSTYALSPSSKEVPPRHHQGQKDAVGAGEPVREDEELNRSGSIEDVNLIVLEDNDAVIKINYQKRAEHSRFAMYPRPTGLMRTGCMMCARTKRFSSSTSTPPDSWQIYSRNRSQARKGRHGSLS